MTALKWLYLTLAFGLSLGQVLRAELTLGTFNAGLAHHFVPLATERLEPVTQAIVESEFDVLCLQEVWRDEDREHLQAAVQDVYPHMLWARTENEKTPRWPACTPLDLFGKGSVVSCMQKACADAPDAEAKSQCIKERCRPQFDALAQKKPQCAAAFFAQVGKSSIRALVTLLLTKAGVYAYKGRNGLLLLSKKPFVRNGRFTSMVSTTNRRAALGVQFEHAGQLHTALCTHLTANLEAHIPYTGPWAGEWEEENYKQSRKVWGWAEQMGAEPGANDKGPIYIMGDFNFSPSLPSAGIAGDFEMALEFFLSKGYVSPIIDTAQCTSCASNPLKAKGEKNTLLDHVFVKRAKVREAEIVLDQEILVGDGIKTRLSDHYGVRVVVEH